jgi:hypothetical protein
MYSSLLGQFEGYEENKVLEKQSLESIHLYVCGEQVGEQVCEQVGIYGFDPHV